jgi:hypothetical protein
MEHLIIYGKGLGLIVAFFVYPFLFWWLAKRIFGGRMIFGDEPGFYFFGPYLITAGILLLLFMPYLIGVEVIK